MSSGRTGTADDTGPLGRAGASTPRRHCQRPPQSGKTTLLKQYQAAHGGTYRTLDNRQDAEAATEDPVSFAREGAPPRLIDEVHRGGDWLIRAIKMTVDEDPRPGQFVLSGSSCFLAVPTLSESLAGRAAFIDLWPSSGPAGVPISSPGSSGNRPRRPARTPRGRAMRTSMSSPTAASLRYFPSPAALPGGPGTTATSPL
jgi:hypothetical protein